MPKILNKFEKNELSTNEFISLSVIFGINVFLLQVYFSNLTQNQNIKWLTHLLIIFSFFFLYRFRNRKYAISINFYLINMVLLNLLLFRFVDNFYDDGNLKIIKTTLILGTITFLISIFLLKIKFLSIKMILLLNIITTISFLSLPNGLIFIQELKFSKNKIFLIFLVILIILIGFQLYTKLTSQNYKLLNRGILFLSIILSFRNDQFDIRDGSYFHISYFSEVIRTLKSGGVLLWDTPSQYGFLSVLIPSNIPFDDSRQAFFLWQAILLIIFNIVVYNFFSKFISSNKAKFIFFTIFVLYFNFADPALIGPQPFPSSSVMRFGPSIILIILIVIFIRKMNDLTKFDLMAYILSLSIVLLWSAESFIYGLAISGAYTLILILKSFNLENIVFKLVPIFSIIFSYFMVNLYTYLSIGEFADIGMYFIYSRTYSQGYGSLPLSMISATLLLYVIISMIFFFIFQSSVLEIKLVSVTLISGVASLIFFTYYLGRAVSNNIMVLIPIFFILFSLIYFMLDDNYLKNSLKLINFVFIILFASSIILQPQLLKTFNQFSFGLSKNISKTELAFDAELYKDLKSKPADSIILSSWAAGIPGEISKELNFNTKKTSLPIPLQLLEEPIDQDKAQEIVSRYIKNNNISVINFYQYKDNEFERRNLYWRQILSKIFNCTSIKEYNSYIYFQCKNT